MGSDEFRLVSPAEVLKHWNYYEPKIAHVLDVSQGAQYPDDVLTCVQLGTMQVWNIRNGKAFAVTELQQYPKYRQLLIFLVGGEDARDWLALGQQHLEAFAKLHNCSYMEFQGRAGWERHARPYGYSQKQVRMRKAL